MDSANKNEVVKSNNSFKDSMKQNGGPNGFNYSQLSQNGDGEYLQQRNHNKIRSDKYMVLQMGQSKDER